MAKFTFQNLQELIESVIESSLVSSAIANVIWQIGTNHTIKHQEQSVNLFTSTTPTKSNWDILLDGLG